MSKNDSPRYPIERSPLYGLTSIHVLAQRLHANARLLRDAHSFQRHYIEGTTERKGKLRHTETPVRVTRRVHNRLLALLSRIEVPAYLHSGTKGRTYVTNAAVHSGQEQYYCTDISNFFQSTSWHHAYLCFFNIFSCSKDISGILATICTYKGHLPTGSPISTILSFFIHRKMFDNLAVMTASINGKMTVLLDDITISADRVSSDFRNAVRREVRQHSLRIKNKKKNFIMVVGLRR